METDPNAHTPSVSLSLCPFVCLSLCLCLSVFLFVCLSLSLSLSLYLSVCLRLCLSPRCLLVCLYLSLFACLSMSLSLCLYVSVCLSLSVSLSVCLSLSVSLSLCLCLSLSLSLPPSLRDRRLSNYYRLMQNVVLPLLACSSKTQVSFLITLAKICLLPIFAANNNELRYQFSSDQMLM